MPAAVLRTKPRRSLVLLVVAAVAMVATMVVLARQAEAAITDTVQRRRTRRNTNGSILLRGNANLVCPQPATCAAGQAARHGPGHALDNNSYS